MTTLLNYDIDARERLRELLELRGVSCRDRLKQSADTAGAELEWAKPSVMGFWQRGASSYGGPAVMAPPGAVFIVLAHHEKVSTIWLRPSLGTLADAIAEAVAYAREIVESEAPGFKWSGDRVLHAIKALIKEHGRAPGKKGVELSQKRNVHIIGMLFAALPDAARADMIKALESVIGMGVCPAMIGLIGKGSVSGSCGVWPLVLPLAPYVDAVIETESMATT